MPACATEAAPGMVIKTESPRVDAARKMVLELILSSGNHNCLVCEANGECELQSLAADFNIPMESIKRYVKDVPPDCSTSCHERRLCRWLEARRGSFRTKRALIPPVIGQ